VSLPSTSGGGPHPGTTRKRLPTPILRCQFRSRPPTNTIYFWPDLPQGFAELNRVLKPAGRAALSIRSREKMQQYQSPSTVSLSSRQRTLGV
jgi:hypothetical protein